MESTEFDAAIDPEFLVTTAVKFPCFSEADPSKGHDALYDIIMDAYEEDNLTEEQDLVVELASHLYDEESPFNLTRAMEIWSKQDLDAFIGIVQAVKGCDASL